MPFFPSRVCVPLPVCPFCRNLLPWVMSGGLLSPLTLSEDVLSQASQSLTRLNNWVPSAAATQSLLITAPILSSG